MTSSIFDIEIRLDINKEFNKMIKYLHFTNNTTQSKGFGGFTFIGAIDDYVFKCWPYRDTAINCVEYLKNLGLPDYLFRGIDTVINTKHFLYYIEFIYNIYEYAMYSGSIHVDDENVKAVLDNIEIIAEKLNYKFVQNGDKFLLTKRDANVDSVIDIVEEDIALLLLEYNDFKIRDNLIRKDQILKAIDKYIEKNQSYFLKVDNDSFKTFGYILNNFGINHNIKEKYDKLSKDELLQWYDKAYEIAIHLIRFADVKKINKERKELER